MWATACTSRQRLSARKALACPRRVCKAPAAVAVAAVVALRRRSLAARVAVAHVPRPRDSARKRRRPAFAVRRRRLERRSAAPALHRARARRRGAAAAWARARTSAMPSRAKLFQWATTFFARRLRRRRRVRRAATPWVRMKWGVGCGMEGWVGGVMFSWQALHLPPLTFELTPMPVLFYH